MAKAIVFLLDALLAAALLATIYAPVQARTRAPSAADSALAFDALAVLHADGSLQSLDSERIRNGLDRCFWGSGLEYNASISVYDSPGGEPLQPVIVLEGNGTGRASRAFRSFAVFDSSNRIAFYGYAEVWAWK